jgi:hypothetical protein
MSKEMMPLIILLVVGGGIVLWGFLTDWTFSGLLPRKGAKCTPDEKDENAKQYVYDENNECTVIKTCKTGWKPDPDTSNTACKYSSDGTECTPTGTPVTNGKYTFDDEGDCNLTSCKNNFKLDSDSGTCDDCIDGYTLDGEACRSCTASDVTSTTGNYSSFDVIGQSYTTEDGKCVPKRVAYAGNNGTVSCYQYCAGTGTSDEPWQGASTMPAEWTGAKCVGVTNGDDYKTLNDTIKCETLRGLNNGDDNNLCICERSDFFYRQDTFEMPSDLTNEDGDAAMSKGWWQGTPDGFELYAGTVEDCEEQAKALGVPAYGIRTKDHGDPNYKNTCWAYPNGWTGAAIDNDSKTNHYTVCTDPTKKVKDSCA